MYDTTRRVRVNVAVFRSVYLRLVQLENELSSDLLSTNLDATTYVKVSANLQTSIRAIVVTHHMSIAGIYHLDVVQ
jgi:hypothetical protein